MSLSHHPNIVRNGLVFYSDPANFKSYPAAQDSYINNISLMLDGESLTDKSLNNFTITNSNVSVSSNQYKYGNNSLYFNGTTSYLSLNGESAFSFGTGDFTIETWYYPSDTNTEDTIYDTRPLNTNSTSYFTLRRNSDGSLSLLVSGISLITGGVTTSSWQHVALCRSNGTTRLFLNGTQVGSSTFSLSYAITAGRPFIGADSFTPASNTTALTGYLDDFRVIKGYARYTSNFTPPIAPLTLPNKSTDLTISKSPISYSSGVTFSSSNGGTISLDGSAGSGVTNSVLTVGPTSTFTVCAWAKWNTTATAGGARRPAVGVSTITNSFEFALGFPYTYSSSKLGLEVGKAGVASQIAYSSNSTPTGVWYHLAGVYKNGSADFYLNGVYQSTVTYSATVNSATSVTGNWLIGTELYNGTTSSNTIGPMNGNVGPVWAYNRILTSGEIFQNYTALKGRFGL